MRRLGRAGAAGLLLLLVLAPAASAQRVVAVGDLHGACEEFLAILREAGVIDKDLAWTGGKTILVQTGDVLDRGAQSRRALDLLMDLVDKAAKQGGEVRPLLGNHEAMVMMGDLRYVSEGEYAAFAGPDSEKIREAEYESYLNYRKQRASRQRKAGSAEDKPAWMKAHPPGYFEFRRAFAPKGKYGIWLRSRDAVTQVGDTAFLHGGLSPGLPMKSIKDINELVRREIVQMDQLWARLASRGIVWEYMTMNEAQTEVKADWDAQQNGVGMGDTELLQPFLSLSKWQIISADGPLWYRGYSQEDEAQFAPQLDKILKRFKIRQVVVGHTIPGSKRISARFDGRVFMIDTGMLAGYFQGRASALEIADGNFKAIYLGEPAQALLANSAKAGQ